MSETNAETSDFEVTSTRDPRITPGDAAPVRPTAVDSTGVERIVGPPAADWTPAQVEPTAEQVRRMDEHNAREAERRGERLDALTNPDNVADTAEPLVAANQAAADEFAAPAATTPGPVEPETPAATETPGADGAPLETPEETPAAPVEPGNEVTY